MARGTLKNLKRSRGSSDKFGKVGMVGPGPGGAGPGGGLDGGGGGGLVQSGGAGNGALSHHPHPLPPGSAADLEGADLVGWLNCECFFSLVLVGLLAALPFNLHTNDLLQTRESYLSRAGELFSDGAFEKAASLYERAVNAEETADGHIFLAEALVRVNRLEEAVRHYGRARDLYQDDREKVAALVNIGKLQSELGQPERAVESYQMVLDLQPGVESPEIADAHMQVGVSLLESQQYELAVSHLETATSILPTLAPAHLLLANAYRDMGQPEKAISRYKKVIKYRPRDATGLSALGFAYHEMGNFKQALNMYRKALSITPTAPDIQYVMAALQGHPVHPHRAPAQYLVSLFDLETRRAAYSHHLALQQAVKDNRGPGGAGGGVSSIGGTPMAAVVGRGSNGSTTFYEVHGLVFDNLPKVMGGMVSDLLGLRAGDRWLDVLDLGCGRGAAGQELAPLANWVIGIDVSKLAIDQAFKTEVYTELKHGDFLVFLKSFLPQSMDLIIAADSLPYIGDLREFFLLGSQVLRPDGLMVFNTDVLSDDPGRKGYHLTGTGRWAHLPNYVRTLGKDVGLKLQKTTTMSAQTHFTQDSTQQQQQQQQQQHGGSNPQPYVMSRSDVTQDVKTMVFVFQLVDK